jgi:hypothetical protein
MPPVLLDEYGMRGRQTPGVSVVVNGVWKVAIAFAVPLMVPEELTKG